MAFLWWLVSFRSEQLFGRSEQSSQVEAATATRRASFRQFWTLDTIECVIETVFCCFFAVWTGVAAISGRENFVRSLTLIHWPSV